MRAEEAAPNLDELKEQWDAAALPEELEALEAFRDERVSGMPRQHWAPTFFGKQASLYRCTAGHVDEEARCKGVLGGLAMALGPSAAHRPPPLVLCISFLSPSRSKWRRMP